ncbi:succinate dehydrogenase [Sulfurifustis variabilis]|uniref:Succinate dehydrogenase n=1 Tax=Sulfurifustis variabilis TaxID=1675686 RepID=A0A1B4V3X6_9GAMM|nr:succinate dehydrogenase, hydrophobic membrane anchor protein [Sulfurifustis variabilis]BAU48216.1 succinate dehydrogenase [Sulfurifustis variabilis]
MKWRGHVSAHTGTGEWLWQRFSALYIGGFTLYVAGRLLFGSLAGHDAWRSWLSGGLVRLGFALLIASLLIHAWTGLRSVYIDYVHSLGVRFAVSFLTALGLIALGLWAARVLLTVAA